jgi:hypothetical protein
LTSARRFTLSADHHSEPLKRGQKRGFFMPSQTIDITVNKERQLSIQVLDADGVDITSLCTITSMSSDPSTVSVGTAFGETDAHALKTGSVQVTHAAVNDSGSVQEVDTVNSTVPAPAQIIVTYTYGPIKS